MSSQRIPEQEAAVAQPELVPGLPAAVVQGPPSPPLKISGPYTLKASPAGTSLEFEDGAIVTCPPNDSPLDFDEITFRGQVTFRCESRDNLPAPIRISAEHIRFVDTRIQCAPGQDLMFQSTSIDWEGAVNFACNGQNGENGPNGHEGHGWCVSDDHNNAWNEYIFATLYPGGDGGHGGDGWPGSNLIFVADKQIFAPGTLVQLSTAGGVHGRGGDGGAGDSKAFAPSSDDCKHGTNFRSTGQAAHGTRGDDGRDGTAGAVVAISTAVSGKPMLKANGTEVRPVVPERAPFDSVANELSDAGRLALFSTKSRSAGRAPATTVPRVVAVPWFRWSDDVDVRHVQEFMAYTASEALGRPVLLTSGVRPGKGLHPAGLAIDLEPRPMFSDRLLDAEAISTTLPSGYRVLLEEVDPEPRRQGTWKLLKGIDAPLGNQMSLYFKDGKLSAVKIGPRTLPGPGQSPFHANATHLHLEVDDTGGTLRKLSPEKRATVLRKLITPGFSMPTPDPSRTPRATPTPAGSQPGRPAQPEMHVTYRGSGPPGVSGSGGSAISVTVSPGSASDWFKGWIQ